MRRQFYSYEIQSRSSPSCLIATHSVPLSVQPRLAYETGDVVTYNNQQWRCALDHVSQENWYPGAEGVYFWHLILDDDQWYPNVVFDEGETVVYNEQTWQCVTAHTSQVDWYPGKPGVYLWELLAEGNDWLPGISYVIGDTVTYEGKTWECTVPHVSQSDWTPGAVLFWLEQ